MNYVLLKDKLIDQNLWENSDLRFEEKNGKVLSQDRLTDTIIVKEKCIFFKNFGKHRDQYYI